MLLYNIMFTIVGGGEGEIVLLSGFLFVLLDVFGERSIRTLTIYPAAVEVGTSYQKCLCVCVCPVAFGTRL